MSVAQDIRKLWGNGSRGLLIALLGLIASALFFAGISVLAFLILIDREFHPLAYQNPQRVLSPIVQPGGVLLVDAYKCNNAGEPVAVSGQPFFHNLDTQALTAREGARQDAYVLTDGCPLRHFANVIPTTLPPGRYQLEGVDVATKGEKVQREAWRTETFCVTDASGEGC